MYYVFSMIYYQCDVIDSDISDMDVIIILY